MAARSYGQYCGVSNALDLIGERWAILIVRDLLVGPRRYTDLKQGLPKIPTNILATRLKELQEVGVVQRVPMLSCGLVYELTPLGRGLEDVVLALGRWGFQTMGEPGEDDVVTHDSMTMAFRTAFQTEVASSLPPTDYEVRIGEVVLRILVAHNELFVTQLGSTASPVDGKPELRDPDLVLAAGPGIRRLISGELTPAEAIDAGQLRVIKGESKLLGRFSKTFHIAEVSAPSNLVQTNSQPQTT